MTRAKLQNLNFLFSDDCLCTVHLSLQERQPTLNNSKEEVQEDGITSEKLKANGASGAVQQVPSEITALQQSWKCFSDESTSAMKEESMQSNRL